MKKVKKTEGFTLMEMLIVIAIIAVLVAIAIPVYNAQMHKARVSADWANLRAYYAELQLDYLTTGEHLPNEDVPYYDGHIGYAGHDFITIRFPNSNQKVTLQAGYYLVYGSSVANNGYVIQYACNQGHNGHELTLGS